MSGHQRDNISLIDLIRSTTYFGTTILVKSLRLMNAHNFYSRLYIEFCKIL
jgi:hypothetical protein